ncbi:MAG: RNA methyltransferase [Chloroflexota bacterium]
MVNKNNLGRLCNHSTSTIDIVQKLQTSHRFRNRHGAFFVEGVRNFIQAVENGFSILTIVHSNKLLTAPLARKFVRQLRRTGTPTVNLSPEQFRQFSRTPRASGIGAIVQERWTPLQKASPTEGLCWIILSKIQSSGNFGTLIRTSEAIGGAGFIILNSSVDPYAWGTVRASMSAIFKQRFIRTNISQLEHWAKRFHVEIIGTSPHGDSNFHHFNFSMGTLLFLGEEKKGLSDREKSICSQLVRIPMVGEADSLNLGVAGSLMMYEVYRNNFLNMAENKPKG